VCRALARHRLPLLHCSGRVERLKFFACEEEEEEEESEEIEGKKRRRRKSSFIDALRKRPGACQGECCKVNVAFAFNSEENLDS